MSLDPINEEFNGAEFNGPEGPHFTAGDPGADVAPWTEINPGRFMPRRVRGSFQGRALG
jgi:hypothetical protein